MPEGQSKKRRFSKKKNVINAEIDEKISKWPLFMVFLRPKNAETAENAQNWRPCSLTIR